MRSTQEDQNRGFLNLLNRYSPAIQALTAVFALIAAIASYLATQRATEATAMATKISDTQAKLQAKQSQARVTVIGVQLENLGSNPDRPSQETRYRISVKLKNGGAFVAKDVLISMATENLWSEVRRVGTMIGEQEMEVTFISSRFTQDFNDKVAAFGISFHDDATGECVIALPHKGVFAAADAFEGKTYQLQSQAISDTDMVGDMNATRVTEAMYYLKKERENMDCKLRS